MICCMAGAWFLSQIEYLRVTFWPDEELPQHRTKPTAVEEPSLMNVRTIIMVIIMIMVLLAVLIEVGVHRRPLSKR